MHHAGLHDRLRPRRGDRVGQPGQSVAAHDQHVTDPAIAQLGQHPGPEPGPLGGLDPHPEYPFAALEVDPDRQVAGLDPDRAAVADPQPDRVDVDDRVDAYVSRSSGRLRQDLTSSLIASVMFAIVSWLTLAP